MRVEQTELVKLITHNMRTLRQQKKMSAWDLQAAVKAVGGRLPRSVIANLENSRRETFTVDELHWVAEALETSIEWLCTSHGPRCLKCLDTPPLGFECLACHMKGESVEQDPA